MLLLRQSGLNHLAGIVQAGAKKARRLSGMLGAIDLGCWVDDCEVGWRGPLCLARTLKAAPESWWAGR